MNELFYHPSTVFTPEQATNIFAPCSIWQMRFHLIITHKGEYVLYKYFPEKCKLWRRVILNAGLSYIQASTAILGAQLTSVSHLKYVLVMCQLWAFIVFALNYAEIQHKVCFFLRITSQGKYLKTNVLVYCSGLIFFCARINSEWYIKEIWGPIFQQ